MVLLQGLFELRGNSEKLPKMAILATLELESVSQSSQNNFQNPINYSDSES